jgi:hypothetical protein
VPAHPAIPALVDHNCLSAPSVSLFEASVETESSDLDLAECYTVCESLYMGR